MVCTMAVAGTGFEKRTDVFVLVAPAAQGGDGQLLTAL